MYDESYIRARLDMLERRIEQLIMRLAQIEEEIKTTRSKLASAAQT